MRFQLNNSCKAAVKTLTQLLLITMWKEERKQPADRPAFLFTGIKRIRYKRVDSL